MDLPVSDDYETLAGMIIHYCESIPEQGSELIIGNYRFKILKATGGKLNEVELKQIHNWLIYNFLKCNNITYYNYLERKIEQIIHRFEIFTKFARSNLKIINK